MPAHCVAENQQHGSEPELEKLLADMTALQQLVDLGTPMPAAAGRALPKVGALHDSPKAIAIDGALALGPGEDEVSHNPWACVTDGGGHPPPSGVGVAGPSPGGLVLLRGPGALGPGALEPGALGPGALGPGVGRRARNVRSQSPSPERKRRHFGTEEVTFGAVAAGDLGERARLGLRQRLEPINPPDFACDHLAVGRAHGVQLKENLAHPPPRESAGQDQENTTGALRVPTPLASILLSELEASGIPLLDPWDTDRGKLIHALGTFGAVFLKGTIRLPDASYERWRDLWEEACHRRGAFNQRKAARTKCLTFGCNEDLSRTMEGGDHKTHVPDVRHNFGVPFPAMQRNLDEWGDLVWIAENCRRRFDTIVELVNEELVRLAGDQEPRRTLGGLVRGGEQRWRTSRFRHCVYRALGSCTEHTDYGVITLQESTTPGLQAWIGERWRSLHPPPGCALVFAGDMLERLTNGSVKALKHRVRLGPGASDGSAAAGDGPTPMACYAPRSAAVRQSHILFVQPDKDTIVQPFRAYLRGDGTDMQPVRYGDWHSRKSNLAHHWPAPSRW